MLTYMEATVNMMHWHLYLECSHKSAHESVGVRHGMHLAVTLLLCVQHSAATLFQAADLLLEATAYPLMFKM